MSKKKSRLRPELSEKKEPRYIKWIHEVLQPDCFVCGTYLGIQIHHIKRSSSDKKKDNEVIPLCYEHHLGNEFSVHGTPNIFRDKYTIDEQKKYAKKMYSLYKRI